MRPYSNDLRERVAAAVDHAEGSLREIARRFRVSNSRPPNSDSPLSPHFDNGSKIPHSPHGRRRRDEARPTPNRPDFGGLRPLFGGDCAPRTRRSFYASTGNGTSSPRATSDYDEFSKTGFCGAMPRTKALSNSAIESNNSVRKWLRISSQRWHFVFILRQAAWNNGQHSCWT
jgi:hypothetical protein